MLLTVALIRAYPQLKPSCGLTQRVASPISYYPDLGCDSHSHRNSGLTEAGVSVDGKGVRECVIIP